MGKGRNWTQEEYDYLQDKWGTISLKAIAKKLNRSENAVLIKVSRLGLGPFLDSGVGYEVISEIIGKSVKAIRGKVYVIYGTEVLDKVREKRKAVG